MRYIKYSIFVTLILFITGIMASASNADEIRTIEFSVGNEYMYINEYQIKIEKPYVTDSNTIMVPVRAVAEALGAEVDWQGDTEPYKVYIKCSGTKAVYTSEGYVIEHLYQKNDIYYWLCAVAHSEEKEKYYEDLMKTFSLKSMTGDNVLDLSIINSMANIE